MITASDPRLTATGGGSPSHRSQNRRGRCLPQQARVTPRRWILHVFEYKFYSCFMSSLAPDRLLVTPSIGAATPSTPGWRLTAEEEATAVAELKQAAAGWAALLAECAGLALGYGEHQLDAARKARPCVQRPPGGCSQHRPKWGNHVRALRLPLKAQGDFGTADRLGAGGAGSNPAIPTKLAGHSLTGASRVASKIV